MNRTAWHCRICAGSVFVVLCMAQVRVADAATAAVTGSADAAFAAQPLFALPYTPALDISAMNRAVDPCSDFYTYSCGAWQKNNPIPADEPSWNVYSKLELQNLQYLWGILLEAGRDAASRTPAQQLSGDLFAACMDEAAIEARGLAPLRPGLDEIAALRSKRQLPALLASLQATGDDGFLFNFSSAQDPNDSNTDIATLFSGGLGLPDRDYYFKPDARSIDIRAHYRAHIVRMLRLLGDDAAESMRESRSVMKLETALAAATLTLVAKRDPKKLSHRLSPAGLQRLTPGFSWAEYFKATAAGDTRIASAYPLINATEPAFFRAAGHLLQVVSIQDLRVYLRWHWLNLTARILPRALADESFDFYQHDLRGTQRQPPRWKTCVGQVDSEVGEALGQLFVEGTFSAATRQRALEMLTGIQAAMRQRIQRLDWMSPATQASALEKLATMRVKIGYPERWRDYSGLLIQRSDYFGDIVRSGRFERARELAKIGKPVNRDEWDLTPPTVNADYDPQMNDINFPAGVLQAPLFDPQIDSAPNWGNTGATMGHELTHGFDDEGRQFNAKGNLHDWWGPKDAKAFNARAQCVVDQYSGYTAIDDVKVNGRLTLGENIADLGGTILAYIGWKAATAQMALQPVDGLAPEQRFFVGMAQWACGSEKPEFARLQAATNPHAPLRDRINGVVVNMPEFAKAFSCRAGQPMVKAPGRICRIW